MILDFLKKKVTKVYANVSNAEVVKEEIKQEVNNETKSETVKETVSESKSSLTKGV